MHRLQIANGTAAIRARDMTRSRRERLLRYGFLQEVIKAWSIPSRPDEVKGERLSGRDYAHHVRPNRVSTPSAPTGSGCRRDPSERARLGILTPYNPTFTSLVHFMSY